MYRSAISHFGKFYLLQEHNINYRKNISRDKPLLFLQDKIALQWIKFQHIWDIIFNAIGPRSKLLYTCKC